MQKEKIIIVDDDITVLEFSKHYLGRKYDVIATSSPLRVFDLLNLDPEIRLVITDYNMPEINGIDLANALKRREKPPKVILITANLGEDLEREAKAARIDAALIKPYEPEELGSLVAETLKN